MNYLNSVCLGSDVFLFYCGPNTSSVNVLYPLVQRCLMTLSRCHSAWEKKADLDLMCLRNTFHHFPLSQYLSLSPKMCTAARKTQPTKASKSPLGLGHFWCTLTLYLEPESDCLIHIEGRTSLDTENAILEPEKIFQLLQG